MRILRRLKAPLSLSTIVALMIASGTLSGCSMLHPQGSSSTGVKSVGSLDEDELATLPEFKKAKDEIEVEVKKIEATLPKPKPGQRMTPALEAQVREARLKAQQEENKRLNPLKTKVEAAITAVARNKNLMVVLDKKIVVYGVPDITEDVKKAFEAPGDLKLADEVDTTKSPIGYFDQEVVRALRAFQEADMDIYRKRTELLKKYEDKARKAPPDQRPMLEQSFRLELENYQQQVMTPLTQKVNDAVKEVAGAEGVSLVLDKQHVMHGGRNMTNEVVEAFLKKVGGASTSTAPLHVAPSPTPSAGAH
jgi:Skp family chaperone for outer membrane proteins